ncbi:ELMO/CED-12 family protein, partial [Dictyocaulus viviparus]
QNREEVSIREEEHKHVTKQIVPQTKFCNSLVFHLAYDTLCQQVESLREEMYDNGNESHKEKLLELWRLLRPDDQIFSCYGKHWRLIGFQSDDPSRDFRGMGILSLEQLIYMAKTDTKNMRSILVLSNHPKIGFPLVITAINMTSLCHHLLKEGLLKNHFRNLLKNHLRIEDFHDAYSIIFKVVFLFYSLTIGRKQIHHPY